MPYGYNGTILHVDLNKGKIEVENPPEEFYRKYMGGSAMGTYYILQEMPAGADPLGPDNVVITVLRSQRRGAFSVRPLAVKIKIRVDRDQKAILAHLALAFLFADVQVLIGIAPWIQETVTADIQK